MQHSAPSGSNRFHEHRDETRHWVDQPPLGEVSVRDRHHVQPVQSIRDVSVRGVSLLLPDALMPGEPVVIQLSSGGQDLEFYAYVCWCRCRQTAESDWQDIDGRVACDNSPCAEHVAGLRVYGPQSLSRLIGIGAAEAARQRGARDVLRTADLGLGTLPRRPSPQV